MEALVGKGTLHATCMSVTTVLVTGPVRHRPQDTWSHRHKLLNWAWYR